MIGSITIHPLLRPVTLGLLLLAAGCGKPPPHAAEQAEPWPLPADSDAAWSPERIAADPDGYLQYADARISKQVTGREERLAQLEQRRAEIEKKSDGILQQVADAKNIHTRLSAAIQRAQDEDRWPLKFAGRTFTQEKALAVLEATASYQKEREPLAAAYREALAADHPLCRHLVWQIRR